MLHIIVDQAYEEENPLVHRTALMNLVTASGQMGYANAYAREYGFEEDDWLLVSPVYFHTTHRDVLMISDGFSKALDNYYQIFSKFIEADGWTTHRLLPHLWLMKASRMPTLPSAPLFDITHQSLKPFLDTWPKEWKTWFTEIQMLFETEGDKIVNGVWVWGSGEYVTPAKVLTYQDGMVLNDGDFVFMNPHDTPAFLKSKRTIHWWWQDKDFIQQSPSFWKRFKQWVKTYGN